MENYYYVKSKLNEIMIVEDLINFNDFTSISNKNIDLIINEDQLYHDMLKYKKIIQLNLNFRNNYNEYIKCHLMDYDKCSQFYKKYESIDGYNKLDEDSLINDICKFIECYQLILSNERIKNTKFINNNDKGNNLDSIITSKCFFCNHNFDKDILNCSLCGANSTDLKEYAFNHQLSIKNCTNIDNKLLDIKIDKSMESISNCSNIDNKLLDVKIDKSMESIPNCGNILEKKEEPDSSYSNCSFTKSLIHWECDHCFNNNNNNCNNDNNTDNKTKSSNGCSWILHDYVLIDDDISKWGYKIHNYESVLDIDHNHYKTCSKSVDDKINPKNQEQKTTTTNSKWVCNKCGLINVKDCVIPSFCDACLSPSSHVNKWICEQCQQINNYFNEKCCQCKYINRNIISCIKCQIKIPVDREFCDKCFGTDKIWRCWNTLCNKFNNGAELYCERCGIGKYHEYNYDCFQKKKGVIKKVWVCESCFTINDRSSNICSKKSCHHNKELSPIKTEITFYR